MIGGPVHGGRKVLQVCPSRNQPNLAKSIRYYLACKVALVAATLLPVLLGVPVPFSPVQIILLELFMDVGAASTFVAERAESDLMRQPPRDARAPFMNGAMGRSILLAAA